MRRTTQIQTSDGMIFSTEQYGARITSLASKLHKALPLDHTWVNVKSAILAWMEDYDTFRVMAEAVVYRQEAVEGIIGDEYDDEYGDES